MSETVGDSRWSLWSRDSVLSIGSRGSVLSIGSIGSVLSVGSVGSAGSLFSVGSFLSLGGVLIGLVDLVRHVLAIEGVGPELRRPGEIARCAHRRYTRRSRLR